MHKIISEVLEGQQRKRPRLLSLEWGLGWQSSSQPTQHVATHSDSRNSSLPSMSALSNCKHQTALCHCLFPAAQPPANYTPKLHTSLRCFFCPPWLPAPTAIYVTACTPLILSRCLLFCNSFQSLLHQFHLLKNFFHQFHLLKNIYFPKIFQPCLYSRQNESSVWLQAISNRPLLCFSDCLCGSFP